MATLKFCGAAGTVTGSCSLVESDHSTFLIDCGLFQGNKTTSQLNYEPFPFDPTTPDFLILTHAHIDHSGLLPKLVRKGFNGPIFATPPTVDMLEFMLLDSASIQESNVERNNRKNRRRGLPEIEPLYTGEDALATLKLLEPIEYESWHTPGDGVDFRFWNAGHILGSASAELKLKDKGSDHPLRLLFSGDIGPDEKVFHPEASGPEGFDYLVCESTYGDREREDYTLEKRRASLRDELTRGLKRGGNVVIPSFAVERSQELLHDIGVLLATGQIPDADVYLDSPLAKKVTEVFIRYAATLEDIEIKEADLFRSPQFHLVESVEESMQINQIDRGAIIVSASGMCDAGRIQHHLKANIWRKQSTILFVGYQAPGSLGNIITSGARDVRIHGKEFKVRASIRQIGNYSAHADQGELCDWIMERTPVPGGIFLNHGDDDARTVLREKLGELGLEIEQIFLPAFDEIFELTAGSAASKGRQEKRVGEDSFISDWHNEYAIFTLELANQLEQAATDRDRINILEKLSQTLGQ